MRVCQYNKWFARITTAALHVSCIGGGISHLLLGDIDRGGSSPEPFPPLPPGPVPTDGTSVIVRWLSIRCHKVSHRCMRFSRLTCTNVTPIDRSGLLSPLFELDEELGLHVTVFPRLACCTIVITCCGNNEDNRLRNVGEAERQYPNDNARAMKTLHNPATRPCQVSMSCWCSV